ncbi:CAP domain-containing protein [Solibacillus sp. FSL H8-0538]|uniref:CAP domain-containing protein n=1 Tax=Solibacillus sp. FSL H8-0538 TaxID=2921400 RepID=UPI0030F96515
MKTLFRILIVATFLGIIYYYSNDAKNEYDLLEGPNQTLQAIPKLDYTDLDEEAIPRPKTGISTLIDTSSDEIVARYGTPSRIDITSYGYEWWVYNETGNFLMVGVWDGIVTQLYTNEESIDVAPYSIGQTLNDIYRMTIFESEVTVKVDDNVYMFSMNEEDMQSRILVEYEGVYAQLYIDYESQKLSGIRFMNGQTLAMHQPYELQFVGDLIESPTPSSFLQMEINLANANQLADLVNAYRTKMDLPKLTQLNSLNFLASAHSEDMFLENFVSHNSPTYGSLTDRLDSQQIEYELSAENLATGYLDVIEVVHGWMNSTDHREVMFDEAYTHIGSGAFVNYYTQVYIEKKLTEASLIQ